MKEQTNTLFKIPNNEEGKMFLALAKKYINADSYLLRQRGRTPNKKKLKKDKQNPRHYHQHTPLKYADNLGIYLQAKHEGGLITLGIETLKLTDYYRKLYFTSLPEKRVSEINRDVLPFLQTAVKQLANLTGYKEGT